MTEQVTTYLTVDEVAEYYRTSPDTVRYWRHTGYGPRGAKVGRRVLYPRGEIQRWDEYLIGGDDAA